MVKREFDNFYGMNKEFFGPGLAISISLHVILFLLACFRMRTVAFDYKKNEPFVVYSVSVEGGKKLGGISQVSKTGKKEPLVPFKKVEEKPAPAPKVEPKAEVKVKEEVKVKKEPQKVEAKEKAEVSVADKKKDVKKEIKEVKEVKKEIKPANKATTSTAKSGNKNTVNNKNAKPNGVKGGTGTGGGNLDTQLQKALQRYIGESSDAGGVGFGAAKITGGNGMGGGVVRPPEFFKYKDVLVKHIKSNWNWFDTSQPYKAQVEMFIDKKGMITNYKIVTSSGLERFDDSILRAIQKSSPVPIPPDNVYEFFKEIRLVFDPRE